MHCVILLYCLLCSPAAFLWLICRWALDLSCILLSRFRILKKLTLPERCGEFFFWTVNLLHWMIHNDLQIGRIWQIFVLLLLAIIFYDSFKITGMQILRRFTFNVKLYFNRAKHVLSFKMLLNSALLRFFFLQDVSVPKACLAILHVWTLSPLCVSAEHPGGHGQQ